MFKQRHIGPSSLDCETMLAALGVKTRQELMEQIVPHSIFRKQELNLAPAELEDEALQKLKTKAAKNKVYKSLLGQGYVQPKVPSVIQRNILENPCWYTQYTPYQSEIAQGRLEALLNFQTMVCDLTGMAISNASLLDEATAAAEGVAMAYAIAGQRTNSKRVFLDSAAYLQTKQVIHTRADAVGFEVVEGSKTDFLEGKISGCFVAVFQNPDDLGSVVDLTPYTSIAKNQGALSIVIADLYTLCLTAEPAKQGADIVVGNTQAFGVPMGFGGPHAAYLATRDEYKRLLPGRLISVSKDSLGQRGLRLALQTREQHIRREKATSNICTAQVLLAIMASMYAVYHGPEGVKEITGSVYRRARRFAGALNKAGIKILNTSFTHTITFEFSNAQEVVIALEKRGILIRSVDHLKALQVTVDESTKDSHLESVLEVLGDKAASAWRELASKDSGQLAEEKLGLAKGLHRQTPVFTHPVFSSVKSETEMLRYITELSAKDLSLAHSMIPLGSCTMKLNSTTEMLPVSWSEFSDIHPFAPKESVTGYYEMIRELEDELCEITGFDAVSLQPNAGSQGEYAGLLAIRGYHRARGDFERDVCLIPQSAHGTNPASAVMAGMKVVVVACDQSGNISAEDLSKKIKENAGKISCMMVTYPSTHGVYEESIKELCEMVHQAGGQVYMDGANMNAQVGLTRPGDFGPDVCHLNLHKTFCIPHGGGGPGVGPIGVKKHLSPYLPSHFIFDKTERATKTGPVSAAPFGSASILVIPHLYIRMMGPEGLREATEVAILNANYMAKKLEPHFPVLYKGRTGFVAHECILDLRPLKEKSGVEVEDVAKRLMDYGFHAPTVSFPVAGTLMIEPTESEGKDEMDRFLEAMISIRKEIQEIIDGKFDIKQSVLKNAPHPVQLLTLENWDRPYSREKAVYPAAWLKKRKFWPSVGRIDNVFGERNLICTCPPLEDY